MLGPAAVRSTAGGCCLDRSCRLMRLTGAFFSMVVIGSCLSVPKLPDWNLKEPEKVEAFQGLPVLCPPDIRSKVRSKIQSLNFNASFIGRDLTREYESQSLTISLA